MSISKHMTQFFESVGADRDTVTPSELAAKYAKYVWDHQYNLTDDLESNGRSRFNIGLCGSEQDISILTRRGMLISDSLLVSTGYNAQGGRIVIEQSQEGSIATNIYVTVISMQCDDADSLGRWIADSEHILRKGLVWFLPTFHRGWGPTGGTLGGPREERWQSSVEKLVNALAEHRITTQLGQIDPIVNSIVRPVLRIELPFIDGVSLADFSRITVDELASYEAFRSFLRKRFLALDEAVNAEQMDRELTKIGLEIGDGIRAVRSDLSRIRRKRAVAATGAAIGTAAAILVAVYGPALVSSLSILGASGGIWGLINAAAEARAQQTLQEDQPWYYAWVLSRTTT